MLEVWSPWGILVHLEELFSDLDVTGETRQTRSSSPWGALSPAETTYGLEGPPEPKLR
jgi:hypothetical protein